MAARKAPPKLSGLLSSGAVPQADPAVLERLPALAEQGPGGAPLAIALDLIDPSPFQPRLAFDPGQIGRLADSIREGALGEPVCVREKPGGRYELVSGERRWRAHRLLGLPAIEASVRALDDRQAARLAIAANTAREDLSDFELGRCFQKALDGGHAASVAELARFTGISRQQIDRCLNFLKLPPEIAGRLEQNPGGFGANCAEFFAGFVKKGFADAVIQAARMILDEGAPERKAMAWLKSQAAPAARPSKRKPRGVALAAAGKALGTARLEPGRLVIDCAGGAEPGELLNLILALLKQAGRADAPAA